MKTRVVILFAIIRCGAVVKTTVYDNRESDRAQCEVEDSGCLSGCP